MGMMRAAMMILIALAVAPSGAARGADPILPEVEAIVREAVAAERLSGIAVIAIHRGRLLHRGFGGDIGPDTPVRMASASKWVAGLVLMTLVADRSLTLETTPASLGLTGGPAERATLAQLMSHTAGIVPLGPLRQGWGGRDLDGDADSALAGDPLAPPGTAFAYGGTSMQVAGRMAELAGGADWNCLFRQRLADPLGLSPAATFTRRGRVLVGGSLTATATDMLGLLALVRGRGVTADGRRLIPADLFDAMERDIAGTARRVRVPTSALDLPGYGVGLWCERIAADGRCPRVSSPGFFGAYPFMDRDRDLYGLILVDDRLTDVLPYWRRILTVLDMAADAVP